MDINKLTEEQLVEIANWELRWAHGNYGNELLIRLEDAELGSHQGRCDEDVEALSEMQYIAVQLEKIKEESLRSELREYGAWSEQELLDHSENIQRWVWLCCGQITESEKDNER